LANPQHVRLAWSAHFSLVKQIQSYYQLASTQLETALLGELQRIGVKNSSPAHISAELACMALVDHGVNPNTNHKSGSTVVHIALAKRAYDLVHLLVERGADINAQKSNGNTALHDASIAGEERLSAWLIGIGANPNILNVHGDSAALAASKASQWKIAFLLLKRGCDINTINHNSESIFHIACQNSAGIPILHKLIDMGADMNHHGFAGNTALHILAAQGNYDMMQALLDRRAEPNVLNSGLSSPLHLATFHNYITCVQLLIKYGGNPNMRNADGNTIYYFARLLKHTRLLEFFHAKYSIHISRENGFFVLSHEGEM
jgi:ankyrin repeat protein